MGNNDIPTIKRNIIAIGRLLWEKDLASALNGNISVRVDEDQFLITGTKTCLGLLQEKEILLVNLKGEVLDEGQVSTEKLLHLEVYRNFPKAQAVIHTHTTFTNGYFLKNQKFMPKIFEAKLFLGEILAVDQNTPAVNDVQPVISSLKKNNVMVLRKHGTVARGENLFDCFLMIQSLEEAIKTDVISRLYEKKTEGDVPVEEVKTGNQTDVCKFKLFSDEQIKRIVELVNGDSQLIDLGAKTAMTMDLAVKLNETGQTYCFQFENGRINQVTDREDVEFLISADEKVWRAVFNREIDPFVATTQKKMDLKGDYGKISRWYAPCSRIFELWAQVPVE